jgi:hypothetical protein
MKPSLWLQVGPNYGFSQAVEDWSLRDFERSQAAGGVYFAEVTAEATAEQESSLHRLAGRLASLVHPARTPDLRQGNA